MMLLSLIVFASLLAVGSAIVNGTISGRHEFPFVVSLQWDRQHKCGGTLIDANTILTAAHCYPLMWVDPKQPSRVTALLGSRDQHADGRWFRKRVGIRRIIWHPDFPDKYKSKRIFKANLTELSSDYMLLKMNHSVCPNIFIKYATLAGENNGKQLMPRIGDQCVPVGWGRYKSPDSVTNWMANDFSSHLRKGLVKIVPDKECWKRLKSVPTMLCAKQVIRRGKPQGLICFGDSGSPLICRSRGGRAYVAGFAEAGSVPCNMPNGGVFFMRVAPIRKWIDDRL